MLSSIRRDDLPEGYSSALNLQLPDYLQFHYINGNPDRPDGLEPIALNQADETGHLDRFDPGLLSMSVFVAKCKFV
jgi:hypothetical protein